VPSEREQTAPDMRHHGKQGCAMLAAACAIVLMVCVLGGLVVQLRGEDLPELNGQVGG